MTSISDSPSLDFYRPICGCESTSWLQCDREDPTSGNCKGWLAIVSQKAKKSYGRFLLLKWLLGVFIPLLFLFICRVVGCSVISFTLYLSLSLTCFTARSRGFYTHQCFNMATLRRATRREKEGNVTNEG